MFETSAPPFDAVDVQGYRRDGYLIARDVFTPHEVEAMDAEATRLLQRTDLIDTNNIRCRWQDDIVSGECRFDCSIRSSI